MTAPPIIDVYYQPPGSSGLVVSGIRLIRYLRENPPSSEASLRELLDELYPEPSELDRRFCERLAALHYPHQSQQIVMGL